jgi:hypothetical protein
MKEGFEPPQLSRRKIPAPVCAIRSKRKEEPLQAPLLLSDVSMGKMHRKANSIFRSMQMEGHVDHDLNRHWMSLEHGRLELVLPDCLDSFFFEAHAKVADQGYILRVSL